MLVNVLALVILIALLVLFAWLTRRAWRAKNAPVKWVGTIVAGILTLLLVLVTVVMAKGFYDLYRAYPVAAVNVSIAGTPEQIARGEHLAAVVCAGCHSQNGELPLSGGRNLSQDAGLPLGDLYPSNLTPAGEMMEHSDADIFRILRTGVEPSGRLTGMAFFPARYLSDEDAKAVIAYLRHSPSVQAATPAANPSPLFLTFLGLGLIKAEAADLPIQPVTAPPKAATKEYGEYVLNFMGCKDCHGPTLSGDAPPPAPRSPNLTSTVPKWTKEQFFKAMREGVTPTGHQLQPPMDWKATAKLEDVELEALFEYLHALTPIEKK